MLLLLGCAPWEILPLLLRFPREGSAAPFAGHASGRLYGQLRIRFYIHQNFPGDDFGVSKIKVKQACLNKL
jgi:hypothetical protein